MIHQLYLETNGLEINIGPAKLFQSQGIILLTCFSCEKQITAKSGGQNEARVPPYRGQRGTARPCPCAEKTLPQGTSHLKTCVEKLHLPTFPVLTGAGWPDAAAGRVGKPFGSNMRGVSKEKY